MMGIHRGYEPATGCSGSARNGARELMSWYLGAYEKYGAANLGIYLCKSLGSGWSLHAEGRATDLGTAPYGNPTGIGEWPKWGWELANALYLNSLELGIQLIIFDRKIWSGTFWDQGWRDYSGSNPHTGHLHVELSTQAAADLTAPYVESVIGGKPAPAPPPPAPKPTPPITTDWLQEAIMSMPTLRRGARGEHVKTSMALLDRHGFTPANSRTRTGAWDGIAGAGWETAVKRWQAARKVRNSVLRNGQGDGIFGRASWTHAITGKS